MGKPSIKAMNALSDFLLPCRLRFFFTVWLHTDKQLPRKYQALITTEHQRIFGNSIKFGRHS